MREYTRSTYDVATQRRSHAARRLTPFDCYGRCRDPLFCRCADTVRAEQRHRVQLTAVIAAAEHLLSQGLISVTPIELAREAWLIADADGRAALEHAATAAHR